MKTTELLLETSETEFQMGMMYKLLKKDQRGGTLGIVYHSEFRNALSIVVFCRSPYNHYECIIRYFEEPDNFTLVFKKNDAARLFEHDIRFEDVPAVMISGFKHIMEKAGESWLGEAKSTESSDMALVWHLVAQLLKKRKFVQFYASSQTGRFINGQITSISPDNFISFSSSCTSAIMFICPDDDDLFTIEKRAGHDMYVVKNIKNKDLESAHEDL
jgi:hypothetical protein